MTGTPRGIRAVPSYDLQRVADAQVRRKYAESTPRRQVADRSWQTVADHGRKNSTLCEHLLTSAAGTAASYNCRSRCTDNSMHVGLPAPPRLVPTLYAH